MIEPSQESPNMLREIREGLGVVYQHSLLRFSAVVFTIISLSGGIFSALVVLYMGRELGFDPGILGMIWAVGGVSSFFGASLTPYITRRLNPGSAMTLREHSLSCFDPVSNLRGCTAAAIQSLTALIIEIISFLEVI